MMSDKARITKHPATGVVCLNHEGNLNALSPDVLEEISHALDVMEADTDIRVLILTGTGKAFSAGADIRAMALASTNDCRSYLEQGQRLLDRIELMSLPVIAAVNGVCTGGGCALAGACDITIAAESATFGEPESKLGLPGGFGNVERLVRRVGHAFASELLLTGRIIDADEALQKGLVSWVVPDEWLEDNAVRLAAAIAGNSPTALREIKKLLHTVSRSSPVEARGAEIDAFLICLTEGEGWEGLDAFLSKRAPSWKVD